MPAPSPDAIVQELLARGVSADDIAAANPALGRRVQAGMIAPRLVAPDKMAERQAYGRDYSKISAEREDLGKFYPQQSELERFGELNRRQGTGGFFQDDPVEGMERLNPLMWPKAIGHAIQRRDPETSEMAGIASRLQGRARPAGSGATSDFEQRLYRQGVPSPEKPGPVNASIRHYQAGVLQEQSDRLAFQEEFLRRNGSLSGSQESWAKYVTANPYTASDPKGLTIPNSRRADWREHFGIAPQRAAPGPAERPAGGRQAESADWREQLPPAQRKAAQMFKGATVTVGQKGNPYVPRNAGEFTRLPSGSWYLDDDGRAYQKGGR